MSDWEELKRRAVFQAKAQMTHDTRPDDPTEAVAEALEETDLFETIAAHNFLMGFCTIAETLAKEELREVSLPFLTALRARGYDVVKMK